MKVCLSPIPDAHWLKRELLKKTHTKATGVVETSDQRRIDSLLTYNGRRIRLRKKTASSI